jgi:hypothetical protein
MTMMPLSKFKNKIPSIRMRTITIIIVSATIVAAKAITNWYTCYDVNHDTVM